MKYKIKIDYDTGDSFHTERDCEAFLELEWKDLDKAKQALKEIQDHYTYYLFMKQEYSASKKQLEAMQKKCHKKPWISDKSDYSNKYEFEFYTVMLENDEGVRVGESTFWCGYFERLNGADIVPEESDMSFRVN